MNNPTSSKQYVINELPINPADITDGSFTDGIYTITYKKVGKLYFAFGCPTGNGSISMFGIGDIAAPPIPTEIADTIDRFAFKIGVTVNTYYPSTYNEGLKYGMGGNLPASTIGYWNGASYTFASFGTQTFMVIGFLAN